MTYQMLVQTVRKRLQDQEIDNATFESHELICHCCGLKKAELLRDLTQEVSSDIMEKVETLLVRRLKEEPLAYLLGEWDFYGLTLEISPSVLIPRFDTEVLALRGIQTASLLGGKVLDLCCGSGCVGIAVANSVDSVEMILGDISKDAREIAAKNVERHKLQDKVTVVEMNALEKPDFSGFNVILCNPPYINEKEMKKLPVGVKDYEPHLALFGGEDGFDFYRSVIDLWSSALNVGGHLIFEVGASQGGMVESMLEEADFKVMPHSLDTQNIVRVVEGKKVK